MDQQGPAENVGERRASTRFRIQAPAIARVGSREIWAFTRDISRRALYFRTAGEADRPPIGEFLEFVIKIPPSMSFSKPCYIKGRGRTIRVENLAGNESGVVVEILEYHIESESVRGSLEERARSDG
jgi:PilZ domain